MKLQHDGSHSCKQAADEESAVCLWKFLRNSRYLNRKEEKMERRISAPNGQHMVKCGAVYLNSLYDEIGRIWREDFSNCKISALSVIDGNHGIYYAFIVFEEMRGDRCDDR